MLSLPSVSISITPHTLTSPDRLPDVHLRPDLCPLVRPGAPYPCACWLEGLARSVQNWGTVGAQTAGSRTRTAPLGSVGSSEEVLMKTLTFSIGAMVPRLTTNRIRSKSSSKATFPSVQEAGMMDTPSRRMFPKCQAWSQQLRMCYL